MDVRYIPFAFPGLDKVGCAFGARSLGAQEPFGGGNISFEVGDSPEDVCGARQAFMDALGITSWQEAKQVHGAQMLFDPEPCDPMEAGTFEADGLATATPGQALIIKTADCQPVLLAHESGSHVAALHVGWRGNKIRFPVTGVRKFCETYDLKPEDVFAVRGPSLSPAAAEFTNFDTDFGPGFQRYLDFSTMTMDLWKLTNDQLMKAGVPEKQIFSIDQCTMGLDDTFFSYRRTAASPDRETGRQAGIIWMKPE